MNNCCWLHAVAVAVAEQYNVVVDYQDWGMSVAVAAAAVVVVEQPGNL